MVQANLFNDGPFILEASFLPLGSPPFARGLYTGATGPTPCGGGSFSRSYLFSSLEKLHNLEGGTG